tara:strand:- start:73 stop:762 length:690 start_codon:yes stop_codon:yes gene_type:complete
LPHSTSPFPWLVHLLTSSGALLGFFTLLALEERNFHFAALLSLGALSVDSLDGTAARWVDIRKRLPDFNGRRLDDIVDYLNYAIVPAYFMLAAESLAHPAWACLPILSSAFGFCHLEAKTRDDFFRGFPSYWNILAIYLWWYEVEPWLSTLIVVTLSVSVFCPLKFIYPSKLKRLRKTTCILGSFWVISVVGAILSTDVRLASNLMILSLAYPLYYLSLSVWLGGWFQK